MGENTFTFAAIVGFVLPPIIAAINREKWSGHVKAAGAFLVCLLAALGTVWYEASVNWHDYRQIVVVVFGSAIATYHWVWKPSGIAPAIEKATG